MVPYKCICAASEHPELNHSRRCRRLQSEENVAYTLSHLDDDVMVPQNSDEPEVSDDDTPLPEGHPDTWTEEEWLITSNTLEAMPIKECVYWETIIYQRLSEPLALTSEAPPACTCEAEKFGGLHTTSCPVCPPSKSCWRPIRCAYRMKDKTLRRLFLCWGMRH